MNQPDEHEVVVDVRVSPENVRVIRLALAGLASRAGFGIDDLENARIVVDEVAVLLGLGSLPESARLRFYADAGPGWMTLLAEFPAQGAGIVDDPLALAVLEALTAECQVTATNISCTLLSGSHSTAP